MDLIKKITAPNSGVFTGEGTNTYLIGKEDLTLVDPGPNIKEHIDKIIQSSSREDSKNISYSYTHRPFSSSITNFKSFKGAYVWETC